MEIISAEAEHILLVVICLGIFITSMIGHFSGVTLNINKKAKGQVLYLYLTCAFEFILFIYASAWLCKLLYSFFAGG